MKTRYWFSRFDLLGLACQTATLRLLNPFLGACAANARNATWMGTLQFYVLTFNDKASNLVSTDSAAGPAIDSRRRIFRLTCPRKI